LASVLKDKAPKRPGGILRKPCGNLKEEYSGLDTEGMSELTDDGVGHACMRSANPQKPGVKAGTNVTKAVLQQQAWAADLLAEQERVTKQVKAAAENVERLQQELARRSAQLDAEAENIGIRVRGGNDTPDIIHDEDEDSTKPDITGMDGIECRGSRQDDPRCNVR
jgi:hypothetical protein